MTLDMEEYLRGVVPAEMYASYEMEALKAQAVAARSYALKKIQEKKAIDVDDTSDFQAYRPADRLNTKTDQAVAETKGQVLLYEGKIIDAVYCDSNGGRTVSAQSRWGNLVPYLIEQTDPYDPMLKKNGHGVGLSQRGANEAAKQGLSYREILSFYYPTTKIQQNYGKELQVEKKTAKGLVDWVLAFVGNPYWYGTCCYPCSEDLLQNKIRQYPAHYTQERLPRYKEDIKQGKQCADCIGLIKGYLWDHNGLRIYDENTDLSADAFFRACTKTGDISSLPERKGLLLWKKGHIGVYIGGGQAVEERSFAKGCCITKVEERSWTNWGYSGFLNYEEDLPEKETNEIKSEKTCKENAKAPVLTEIEKLLKKNLPLSRGDKSEAVQLLQKLLNKVGCDCGKADGIFGEKTQSAVFVYQAQNHLMPDGIAGIKTLTSLLSMVLFWSVTIENLPKEDALSLKEKYPQAVLCKQLLL